VCFIVCVLSFIVHAAFVRIKLMMMMIAAPTEEDRATAIGNVHKTLMKIGHV